MKPTPELGALTTTELADLAAEAGAATLLIPLGATEQHGPHLPLETDTFIAKAWADGVAAVMDNTVVAPPLPYGSSGEHQSFPGTLSIGQEALRFVLVELVRSAGHSFDRVALLSGHGGNLEPVRDAVTQLQAEGHNVLHFFPVWSPPPEGGVDAHAGRTETSLLLYLDAGRVRARAAEVGQTAPIAELMPAMLSGGIAAVAQSGVLGDPTTANAEHGEMLLEQLIEYTVTRLSETPGMATDVE